MTQNSSQLGHHNERRTVLMRKLLTNRLSHHCVVVQHRLTSSADELRWDLRDHISTVRSVSYHTPMKFEFVDSHSPHSCEHLILVSDDVKIFLHARNVGIACERASSRVSVADIVIRRVDVLELTY
jgi:hypothetical protein